MAEPLLDVRGLRMEFTVRDSLVRRARGVLPEILRAGFSPYPTEKFRMLYPPAGIVTPGRSSKGTLILSNSLW